MHDLSSRVVRRLRRKAGGETIHLVWDLPLADDENVGEPLRVSGWAFDPSGIDAVTVRVNRGEEFVVPTGTARDDVAEALNDPRAARAGWSTSLPLSLLQAGENLVEIKARAHSNRHASLARSVRWRDFVEGENPYDQVDLSGERYDPRYPHMNAVAIEHRARYLLAASLANGRRVVDVGCGLGYGAAAMAAAGAASVDAVDANGSAIGIARRNHGNGVRYTIGDIRKLPYADASFDLAVCFEVIEHIVEHDALLEEMRRVLVPDGLVLMSTPNRGRYPPDNPWHLKELTTGELADALGAQFRNVRVLGQQLHLASLVGDRALHERIDPASSFRADVLKLSATAATDEVYAVALASDADLPPLEPLVAIGDPRDELADATIESWSERALAAEAEVAMLRTKIHIARHLGQVPGNEVTPSAPVLSQAETQAALEREIAADPPWMYAWDLGSAGRVTHTVQRRELESIHQTRLDLITDSASQAIGDAGPDARVLDLGCCEGWFAHRMLELGAGSVVGVDVREVNIRRANLVRDQLGIHPARLEFLQADVLALPDLGRFDVVLMLGLIYHLENPVAAMRVARSLTKTVCLVESQLTEQRMPIMAGNGGSGVHFERAASFAAWFEEDQQDNPLASFGSVLSLVPNEAALLTMGRVAGFRDVRIASASPSHNPAYVNRERAVMIALTRPAVAQGAR
ncbi:MAG: methyltransferase domain-containing protein [Solirubrobacteraceae bacterium]|nr:methyltransferase domain-containing protein [Solirubrobacteraceae bacterium]